MSESDIATETVSVTETETETETVPAMITAEEARRMQWTAYNSGYNEGYVKGFASGKRRYQRHNHNHTLRTSSGQTYVLTGSANNRRNYLRGRSAHRGARRGRTTGAVGTFA